MFATRCSLELGVFSFSLYSSLVSLTLLTVDRFSVTFSFHPTLIYTFSSHNFRYIFITRPLHYPTIMTTKRALLSLPLCWLVAVIWSMLSLQGFQFIPENICSLEHALSATYIIIFSLLITFPFFLAISVYTTILHNYRKRQARLRQQEKEMAAEYHYKATITFTTRGRQVQEEDHPEER